MDEDDMYQDEKPDNVLRMVLWGAAIAFVSYFIYKRHDVEKQGVFTIAKESYDGVHPAG